MQQAGQREPIHGGEMVNSVECGEAEKGDGK